MKVVDADVSIEVTVEDAEVSTEDEAVAEEVAESTELADSTDVLDSTDEGDDLSTDAVETTTAVVLAANNDASVLVFTTHYELYLLILQGPATTVSAASRPKAKRRKAADRIATVGKRVTRVKTPDGPS